MSEHFAIARKQGLDLSPADRFKQLHPDRAAQEEASMRYLPLAISQASVIDGAVAVPRSIAVFYGCRDENGDARKFVSHNDARDAFNVEFKMWCDDLPADAELYWRREPVVMAEISFETDEKFHQCTCRVSAMAPFDETITIPSRTHDADLPGQVLGEGKGFKHLKLKIDE